MIKIKLKIFEIREEADFKALLKLDEISGAPTRS